MDKNLLVSVLIPAYNHERFVQEAIRSIISQTYKNIELIVINDGSTDNTHQKIMELQNVCKERFVDFKYISQANRGVAHTLNMEVKLATGNYIFLFSSDDTVDPNAISILIDELKNLDETYVLACGDADFIDDSGRKIYLDFLGRVHHNYNPSFYSSFLQFHTRNRKDFYFKGPDFGTYESFLLGNYIPVGLLVKKESFYDVGLYDEQTHTDDFDMWLKLAKKYKMKHVDKILSHYRLHKNNTIIKHKTLLIKSILDLYIREKNYCLSEGYNAKWHYAFTNILLTRFHRLTYHEFFFYLKQISPTVFLRYGIHSIFNNVRLIPKIIRCIIIRN